jgi:hypothetical protein
MTWARTWGLMEVTFGADNRTKPKVHNIDIGSPYKLSLPGSNVIFTTKNTVSRVSDVYGDQQTTFDQDYSMQRVIQATLTSYQKLTIYL